MLILKWGKNVKKTSWNAVSATRLFVPGILWFIGFYGKSSILQQVLESRLFWEALSIIALQGKKLPEYDFTRIMPVANVSEFSLKYLFVKQCM